VIKVAVVMTVMASGMPVSAAAEGYGAGA